MRDLASVSVERPHLLQLDQSSPVLGTPERLVLQLIALRMKSGRIGRAMATVWADHPGYDPDWRL